MGKEETNEAEGEEAMIISNSAGTREDRHQHQHQQLLNIDSQYQCSTINVNSGSASSNRGKQQQQLLGVSCGKTVQSNQFYNFICNGDGGTDDDDDDDHDDDANYFNNYIDNDYEIQNTVIEASINDYDNNNTNNFSSCTNDNNSSGLDSQPTINSDQQSTRFNPTSALPIRRQLVLEEREFEDHHHFPLNQQSQQQQPNIAEQQLNSRSSNNDNNNINNSNSSSDSPTSLQFEFNNNTNHCYNQQHSSLVSKAIDTNFESPSTTASSVSIQSNQTQYTEEETFNDNQFRQHIINITSNNNTVAGVVLDARSKVANYIDINNQLDFFDANSGEFASSSSLSSLSSPSLSSSSSPLSSSCSSSLSPISPEVGPASSQLSPASVGLESSLGFGDNKNKRKLVNQFLTLFNSANSLLACSSSRPSSPSQLSKSSTSTVSTIKQGDTINDFTFQSGITDANKAKINTAIGYQHSIESTNDQVPEQDSIALASHNYSDNNCKDINNNNYNNSNRNDKKHSMSISNQNQQITHHHQLQATQQQQQQVHNNVVDHQQSGELLSSQAQQNDDQMHSRFFQQQHSMYEHQQQKQSQHQELATNKLHQSIIVSNNNSNNNNLTGYVQTASPIASSIIVHKLSSHLIVNSQQPLQHHEQSNQHHQHHQQQQQQQESMIIPTRNEHSTILHRQHYQHSTLPHLHNSGRPSSSSSLHQQMASNQQIVQQHPHIESHISQTIDFNLEETIITTNSSLDNKQFITSSPSDCNRHMNQNVVQHHHASIRHETNTNNSNVESSASSFATSTQQPTTIATSDCQHLPIDQNQTPYQSTDLLGRFQITSNVQQVQQSTSNLAVSYDQNHRGNANVLATKVSNNVVPTSHNHPSACQQSNRQQIHVGTNMIRVVAPQSTQFTAPQANLSSHQVVNHIDLIDQHEHQQRSMNSSQYSSSIHQQNSTPQRQNSQLNFQHAYQQNQQQSIQGQQINHQLQYNQLHHQQNHQLHQHQHFHQQQHQHHNANQIPANKLSRQKTPTNYSTQYSFSGPQSRLNQNQIKSEHHQPHQHHHHHHNHIHQHHHAQTTGIQHPSHQQSFDTVDVQIQSSFLVPILNRHNNGSPSSPQIIPSGSQSEIVLASCNNQFIHQSSDTSLTGSSSVSGLSTGTSNPTNSLLDNNQIIGISGQCSRSSSDLINTGANPNDSQLTLATTPTTSSSTAIPVAISQHQHQRRQHQHPNQQHHQQQQQGPQPIFMQNECAVCGDFAACQHYGVRTCEGCKGFFKRSVQKGTKYVCSGTMECIVDKRRRNRCQFCRFKKCLDVGMVKEGVRTDSLKGRRGRLPSKPKSPSAYQVNTLKEVYNAYVLTQERSSVDRSYFRQVNEQLHHIPLPTTDMSTDDHKLPASKSEDEYEFDECINVSATDWTPTLNMYSIAQQLPIKHENNDLDEQSNASSRFSRLDDTLWTDILERSSHLIREFVEKIPGIEQLDSDDFELLFRSSLFELFSLIFAFQNKFNLNDGTMIEFRLNCGIVLHRDQIIAAFGSWLKNVENLMQHLITYRVDSRAISCLCALALVNLRNGVRNNNKIEDIQSTLLSSLRDYCDYHSKDKNLFSKLIALLTNAKSLSIDIVKRLGVKMLYNIYKTGFYSCAATTTSDVDQSIDNDHSDDQLMSQQQHQQQDDDHNQDVVDDVLEDMTNDDYDILFE